MRPLNEASFGLVRRFVLGKELLEDGADVAGSGLNAITGDGRARGDVEFIVQGGQLGGEVAKLWGGLEGGVKGLQLTDVVFGDVDPAEEVGAFRSVFHFEHGAGEFECTEPTTETDEVNQVDVAKGDEFAFDIVLGGGHFALELGPIAFPAAVDECFCVAGDVEAGAEGGSVPDDRASRRLDAREIAGGDDEEAVRDEPAEVGGDGDASGRWFFWPVAANQAGRHFPEEIELFEDLGDGGRGQLVDAEFFPKVIIGQEFGRDDGRGGANRSQKGGHEGERKERGERTSHGH